MNVVKAGGLELSPKTDLFGAVNLAIDLSLVRPGEVEVYADGAKVGGFTGGKRTFPPREDDENFPLNLGELERHAIDRALARTGGRLDQAAQLLGIGRTTLYNKLRSRRPKLVLSRAAA